MSQSRARPILMVESTAFSLTTGKEPGSPRHTGQVRVLGSPAKATTQEQNIFDCVESSTCISSPTVVSKTALLSCTLTAAACFARSPPTRDPVRTHRRLLTWWLRQAPCLLYTSPSPRDGLLSRMP